MQITATRTQHNAQRIHKRLRKDPYNVEALFGLAGLLGGNVAERNQKRKVLQRILYLEPHHQSARRMLFEMDRAAIGGDGSRLSLATILPGPSSQEFAEPPLVLRFSLVYRLLIYGFLICGISWMRENCGCGVNLSVPHDCPWRTREQTERGTAAE